jgi:hypothetical protein
MESSKAFSCWDARIARRRAFSHAYQSEARDATAAVAAKCRQHLIFAPPVALHHAFCFEPSTGYVAMCATHGGVQILRASPLRPVGRLC